MTVVIKEFQEYNGEWVQLKCSGNQNTGVEEKKKLLIAKITTIVIKIIVIQCLFRD